MSEFFTFEPLDDLSQPPSHLVSPWSILEWQASEAYGHSERQGQGGAWDNPWLAEDSQLKGGKS